MFILLKKIGCYSLSIQPEVDYECSKLPGREMEKERGRERESACEKERVRGREIKKRKRGTKVNTSYFWHVLCPLEGLSMHLSMKCST